MAVKTSMEVHNTYGYNNQPQYQSGMENQQQELVPQMSVGQWMLTYLLVNIPIVNIVMYIIWLIGKNPKDAIRKNWARGQLFMGLIIFGIMLIFTIIALTVSTLAGGSSSGSSKIDTGVTSDYYAADDDGDQAEDIQSRFRSRNTSRYFRRQTGCRCRADGRNMGGYVIFL